MLRNFNAVSKAAGVSKRFLYNHPDIKQRIETIREQQKGLTSPRQVKKNISDKSKNVIITALREKVKKLEIENEKRLNIPSNIHCGLFYI